MSLRKVLFLVCFLPLLGSALEVLPQKAVILYEEPLHVALKSYAAFELQYHLELLTGVKIPVRNSYAVQKGEYPFYVGKRPESDKTPFKPEEGRFLVTPGGTCIYGKDLRGLWQRCPADQPHATLHFRAQTGTYFAVLEFLEKQFGFRWIEPGKRGIVYRPAKKISLNVSSGAWDPGRLVMRGLRPGYSYNYAAYKKGYEKQIPASLFLSEKEFEKLRLDELVWLKRQRMGRNLSIRYGHAFTGWRERFLKTHPDYLAQDGKGGVRPTVPGWPKHFLLCVSNPGVHQQIMADFRKAPGDTLNICENDGGLFCLCARCEKWGKGLPGESERTYSDRYIKFANIMQGMLDKEFPGKSAVFYIYSHYRFPPSQEKVDPRLIFGFVPELMELPAVGEMYRAWRKAGAGKMFLRPNDHHFNTGLPMGFEKQIYDGFKLGLDNGIIGSDYDTLHNFWPVTGITDYILARAHVHPEMNFEELENDYLSAYGAAAPDVKAFFHHWRNEVWNKRLLPNRKKILERGRYGNYRRGVVWDLPVYFTKADLDRTDELLKKGAEKNLSPMERERLETLILGNRHTRLVQETIAAQNAVEKLKTARALYNFRVAHRDRLHFNWAKLISLEKTFGDVTGTELATKFVGKKAVAPLPAFWKFKEDPGKVGEKETWHNVELDATRKNWETICVNQPWESQNSALVSEKLKARMKNYNGTGYYAIGAAVPQEWQGKGRVKIFFNAVDESATVYLNGKLCGRHIFRPGSDDWKTPFEIDVTDAVDWQKSQQHLVVKVDDTSGQGGIWKPVFMALD